MMTDTVDLSQSPALPRKQITRFVKTTDAAQRITARYQTGAFDRTVRAEVKRQKRFARNRRLAA